MEDLALSIDGQNAEDWTRLPALTSYECQQDQPIISTHDSDQHSTLSHADEPLVPNDNLGQDDGNAGLIEMSLDDVIGRYIPEDSKAALSLRQRKSVYRYVDNFGYVERSREESALSLINRMRNASQHPGQPKILLVEDINLDQCKALCAEYPATLHPALLARHIIRFDEIHSTSNSVDAIRQDLELRYPTAGINVQSSDKLLVVGATSLCDNPMGDNNGLGLYLNFTVETPQQSEFGPPRGDREFREDVFQLDELNIWRLISVRMSCFKLATNLYLVLVDSFPAPDLPHPALPQPVERYPAKIICMNSSTWDKVKMLPNPPEWDNTHVTPLHQIHALFKSFTLQSILQPQMMPSNLLRRRQGRLSRGVFRWLLFASSWHNSATRLESDLRDLQREATAIAGERAFAKLTALRQQLAGAYGMLAESQELMKYELQSRYVWWDVDGKIVGAAEFWSRGRSQRVALHIHDQAKSTDLSDIPALVEELLGRFKTMTRTVNEEIQMVIGSVQVEDARVMRRQTEWTVVLAVLAAIYLPMTLVTGIFGMNITEIGAEATAPDRWSVVKAWGIVFGATMGSVFVYAVARYILRYRRVGRMLLRNIGGGWLYRRFLALKTRLQEFWLYQKVHRLKEKMKEWDVEAQKMEKME